MPSTTNIPSTQLALPILPGFPLLLGLVGMHFRPPAKSLLQALAAGHPLRLRREPENPYDPLAIQVILETSTLTPEHYDAIDLLCQEQGHDRDSISAEPEWHLGYIAAKQPKNGGWTIFAGTIAPHLTPGTDYQGQLSYSAEGAPGVKTSLAPVSGAEEDPDAFDETED